MKCKSEAKRAESLPRQYRHVLISKPFCLQEIKLYYDKKYFK